MPLPFACDPCRAPPTASPTSVPCHQSRCRDDSCLQDALSPPQTNALDHLCRRQLGVFPVFGMEQAGEVIASCAVAGSGTPVLLYFRVGYGKVGVQVCVLRACVRVGVRACSE